MKEIVIVIGGIILLVTTLSVGVLMAKTYIQAKITAEVFKNEGIRIIPEKELNK